MKTISRKVSKVAATCIVVCFALGNVGPAFAQCAMQTQMSATAQTILQDRINEINRNMQALTLLNELQTQCTQGLAAIPTQAVGMAAGAAINQIASSLCTSLARKVRNMSQAAMAEAQAAAQQQINNAQNSVIQSAGNGMLGSAVNQAISDTTGNGSGFLNGITNGFSKLFQ